MKILVYMFEGPISYNKENINIAPSPLGRRLQKRFFEFLWLIWKYWYLYYHEGPISNNK